MKKLYLLLILIIFFVSCHETKKEYYPNGSIKSKVSYKGKIKDGTFTEYYPNGNIQEEGINKNNQLDGDIIWYSSNGIKENVTHFIRGKIEGNSIDYYPTGKIKMIGYFKNNQQNGLTKIFYENGTIKQIANYINGQSVGDCKWYYPDGKLNVYAILENDSYLYWEEYNKQGILIKEDRVVSLIPTKDTIRLNQKYTGKIVVNGPLRKNYKIKYKLILMESNCIIEDSLLLDKHGEVYFSLLPPKVGRYVFIFFAKGIKDNNKKFGSSMRLIVQK